MKRRSFLAASAALSASLLRSHGARAGFGVAPDRGSGLLLPESERVESILEVYLYGGLSPWETLYFVERYGKNQGSFWYQYEDDVIGPDAFDSNRIARELCGLSTDEVTPSFFAKDELGNDVMFGPFASAWKARPDLVDRMRLVVQKHNLLPHEAAVPMALTGKPVGQPSMAGLGAHVQRYFIEQLGARATPYSYVLASGGAIPSDNTAAFVATGTHPARTRPLRINVDALARLELLLSRQGVGDRRRVHDTLVDGYTARWRERLRFQGKGDPLRATRFDELVDAAESLKSTDAVQKALDPRYLVPIEAELCDSGLRNNTPLQSLRLATHLLTKKEERARYVCVVDTGLTIASGGGGYDTHSDQCLTTARNFSNLVNALSEVIAKPGENDPTKLDLSKTLVILNTEFGRTPKLQEGAGGRNHFPAGYVTAFLGGAVAGRSIFGALDDTGVATNFATPAENRMGALLALGIWPYSDDSFFVSDHATPTNEEEGVAAVSRAILGRSS